MEAGTATVGELMRAYEDRTAEVITNPRTRAARLVAIEKIRKTWPALGIMKPSQVTPATVWDWARRFKAEGTNFTPPGAKTVIRGNSATSVNRAIDTLRRIMEIAVEQGAIHTNPATVKPPGEEGRLKKKVEQKRLELPSSANVQKLYFAMENNGARGGWGEEAADFCRFMAFSGCRVSEVGSVTWSAVDWEKRSLHVAGTKSDSSRRDIPLFPALADLLKKVIGRRKRAAQFNADKKPQIEPSDRVFRIGECQKTIDKACASIGIARITHHDFRHLFATRCIESGVDIPTVSRWLGHSDGGALAMKTYGHLRQDHSQAQAAKVFF